MISTKLIKIDPVKPDRKIIQQAARLIRRGRLVAFPTETVYGLGADGLNPRALERIFRAKGRPADNPIILHISRLAQLDRLILTQSRLAKKLAKVFWPGPLTIVLAKSKIVPQELTGGLETLAVRLPAHPVAQALIEAAGGPIAAPSANLSGRPSSTRADHVLTDLGGKIDLILDAGESQIGLESTVLDIRDQPTILRPGSITKVQLERSIGAPVAERFVSSLGPARSPGTKYTHYSPKAQLILVKPTLPLVSAKPINRLVSFYQTGGRRVGVLATLEVLKNVKGADLKESLADGPDLTQVGANLFAGLRSLDRQRADLIICQSFVRRGLGRAIMDRLDKAASSSVTK